MPCPSRIPSILQSLKIPGVNMIGQWFPSISRCTKSSETLRYSGYPQCPKCHARPSMPSQKAPAGTVPPPARRFPRAWVVLLTWWESPYRQRRCPQQPASRSHVMGHLPVGVSGVANHLKYIIIIILVVTESLWRWNFRGGPEIFRLPC